MNSHKSLKEYLQSDKGAISLDVRSIILVLVGLAIAGVVGFGAAQFFGGSGDDAASEEVTEFIPEETSLDVPALVPGAKFVLGEVNSTTSDMELFEFAFDKAQTDEYVNALAQAFGFEAPLNIEETETEIGVFENKGEVNESSIIFRKNTYADWAYNNGNAQLIVCMPGEEDTACNFTAEKAEEYVRNLLPAINGPAEYELDVSAGPSSTTIIVRTQFEGKDVNQGWFFEITTTGDLLRAYGNYSLPQSKGSTPVISLDEVVNRMNDSKWMPFAMPMSVEVDASEVLGTTLVDYDGDGETITLVSAEPSLFFYVSPQGNAWFLPSWKVINKSNNQAWNVVALSEDKLKELGVFLPWEQTGPVTEPTPGVAPDTGAGTGVAPVPPAEGGSTDNTPGNLAPGTGVEGETGPATPPVPPAEGGSTDNTPGNLE